MSDTTPDIVDPTSAPNFNLSLNIHQPVNQDAYHLYMHVLFVTFNADDLGDVPDEHRAFLVDWLHKHTTTLYQETAISGLQLVQATAPGELIAYTVKLLAAALGGAIQHQLNIEAVEQVRKQKDSAIMRKMRRA